MRHLIERVLELSDEEQTKPSANTPPIGTGDEAELKALLESLQPRIRVYGVGGAGCNAINRLFEEKLFESEYVTGYAINTDAQALLMSPIKNKVLIGRTATLKLVRRAAEESIRTKLLIRYFLPKLK